MLLTLKTHDGQIQPFLGRSDILTTTEVHVGSNPRKYYLQHLNTVRPPCISSSDFVPGFLIEHLMRNKKDSALGVKFQPGRTPPDSITNMEGAMHSFVTPIVLAFLHGDYVYYHGHGMTRFEPVHKTQQARTVIVSALIQPDFEGPDVMLALCALKQEALEGQPLPANFSILNVASKQSSTQRSTYDILLQRHMVAHLTQGERLPSLHEVAGQTKDVSQAVSFLEDFLLLPSSNIVDLRDIYVRLPNGSTLSLELLLNSAIHQLRNELSALEALSPQGYVYTSDPPAIFAREIGAEILNRLQFSALKQLASENIFSNMRTFAFNDYADRTAINLLKPALSSQSHVLVVSKSVLFMGPSNTYSPLPGTEGALLVIHNNSDAFGQNIETEMGSGSMDGAIGANSSAAASLHRERSDLLAHLI